MRLKPDTIGQSGGNYAKSLCFLGSPWKIGVREEWKCCDRNLYSFSEI